MASHLKRIFLALAVAVTTAALVAPANAVASPAVDEPRAVATSEDVGINAYCVWYVASGVSGVNMRAERNVNSAIIGTLHPQDGGLIGACGSTPGGSYSSCGGGNTWAHAWWFDGRTGWMARRCVHQTGPFE